MPTAKSPPRSWALQLILNALLWVIPVAALWLVATPVYNRFLLGSAENLVRLTESPSVTNLLRKDDHFAYVQRRDFPPAKSLVHSFRVTDVHFHLVMLGILFLAVPRVPWRRRLENLGWAVLITVFFDIFLIFFYVKFTYATQLGAWSLAHYGPFARNFWGLGKHLLDLPFKFSLPFLLWAGFYFKDLMAGIRPQT
ncbi:MAG TPA: hypothetical protein VIA62_26045 [Thermoanaerobaculia bacterium]|jgi:hypothetical protein|nr:hypothetical protein [Thermoanaerobaculia bacterium]